MAFGHCAANRIDDEIRGRSPAWLEDMNPNILLVFLHMPKAGGTSLKRAIAHVYGRHFVDYHARLSADVLQRYDLKSSADVRALVSHHGYGFHRQFGSEDGAMQEGDGIFQGRDIRYVTLIRDPVERLKSMYYFVTTFHAHRFYEATKEMAPEDFFHFMLEHSRHEMEEIQCGLLDNTETPDFGRARDTLESFYMFGTVENSQGLMEDLAGGLNWPSDIPYERRNASPKEGRADIAPEVVDWIIQHNRNDRKLYDFVKNEKNVKA